MGTPLCLFPALLSIFLFVTFASCTFGIVVWVKQSQFAFFFDSENVMDVHREGVWKEEQSDDECSE